LSISNVTGRRIVEIHHFIRGILDFPHHELFSCAGNHVHLVKELRHGFSSTFILRCNMCNVSHRVSSESSEHTEVEVNSAAVAGITSTSIGLGHANLSQFSSMLNMPSMSQNAYKKIEGDMRTKFYDSLSDLITQAGKEEKNCT
jgi:hypothetical protein